jgi:hypothetical protein
LKHGRTSKDSMARIANPRQPGSKNMYIDSVSEAAEPRNICSKGLKCTDIRCRAP